MLTCRGELDSDDRLVWIVDLDTLCRGLESAKANAMIAHGIAKQLHAPADVVHNVLLPSHGTPIRAKLVSVVLWKVFCAEIIVTFCEFGCCEMFIVTSPGYVARTPTRVDELPLSMVDPDGIPGMSATKSRDGITWLEFRVTKTFSMTRNYNAL